MADEFQALTPNQVVAANMRARRREIGMTQKELGAVMSVAGLARWNEFTVSAAERAADDPNGRRISFEEAVAFCLQTRTPLLDLLRAPEGAAVVFDESQAGDDVRRITGGYTPDEWKEVRDEMVVTADRDLPEEEWEALALKDREWLLEYAREALAEQQREEARKVLGMDSDEEATPR